MKRERLRLPIRLTLLILFSLPASAQVTFFSPPTFYGSGNTFTADFNGDGKPDLLTSDGTLSLGNGNGTFTLATPVSGTPVAVADFNGDGIPDILELGTATLIVLLGNGDGTFQAPISTPSGAGLSVVAAGDFAGNSKADVVGIFNNSLYVYLSNGDGTFTAGNSYTLGSASGYTPLLTVADFNGDGDLDVAVSNFITGEQLVLLGNGNGTFQTPLTTSTPSVGNFAAYAAVGDFNGDGKLDLALDVGQASSSGGEVYLLLGNGDGTFQTPIAAFLSGNAVGMAAADVNGDGNLDLVILSATLLSQVYLGNGNGAFSNASNYMVGLFLAPKTGGTVGAYGLVIADFNGDGKPDFATSNTVLLGNGDGTFQGLTYYLNDFPMVLGAFQNNGILDVAAQGSSGSFDIYSNNGLGDLSLINSYTIPQYSQYAATLTGDFNGDGNLDLLNIGPYSQNQEDYNLLLGNGNGSFQPAVLYTLTLTGAGSCGPAITADFNNDHKLDLAIPTCDQEVAIFLGNGDGTFTGPTYFYDAGTTYGDNVLLAADYNLDGNVDLAISNPDVPGPTFILFGNGDGTFQAGVFPPSLNNFVSLFTADFNNDGKPDLLSRSQVALGNGNGTFTVLPQIVDPAQGIADFNGDGIPDLFVTATPAGGPASAVQLGNGDGTFGPAIDVFGGANVALPFTPLLGDMNGDELADVVFFWNLDIIPPPASIDGFAVLLNTTKTTSPQPTFTVVLTGLSPTPVVAGNSATATVTVSPANGFDGTVALSCGSLPSGASCSFNPATIANGSGTSTLTLTTTTSVSPGSYTIEANGASSNVSYRGATTLTVDSATTPDFQISASNASPLTIDPGSSATSTVSITGLDGFNSAVALSCTSGNSAITCSLNPSSLTPSGSSSETSTLTINTTSAAADGTYSITVTGASSSSQHDTFVTVIVGSSANFTIGAGSGSSSQTINPGQSANFTLSLAPSGSFTGTVDLSCAITPSATSQPTCSLSSSSVQITGSGTQSVTVTVATTASSSALMTSHPMFPTGSTPLLFPVGLSILGCLGIFSLRNRKAWLLPAALAGTALLAACGGSNQNTGTTGSTGTPAGTYTATVTATSGSLSHSVPLTVIVQ
jgi:hypothetical protein